MKHPFVPRRRLSLLEERLAAQKNLSLRRAMDTLSLRQDAARRMDDETFLAFQYHANRQLARWAQEMKSGAGLSAWQDKFDPNQPRVPAGRRDGGRWTEDGFGGGSTITPISAPKKPGFFQELFGVRPAHAEEMPQDKPPSLQKPRKITLPTPKPRISFTNKRLRNVPDYPTGKRASAAYGETSGLTPQLKNPKRSPYDSTNWDEASAENLRKARIYVGIVSERNPRVHFALPPNAANSIEERVWNDSVEAAIEGSDSSKLDKRVTNFFLRQQGIGKQYPDKWPKTLKVLESVGPFNNVGGGDVPAGPNTYIDFYGEE